MAKGGFRANAGRKPKEDTVPKIRGGLRIGAGRPKGTPNKDTAMIKALAKNYITAQEQGIPEHFAKMGPLEVMAHIMVEALAEGNKQLALSASSQLAPYIAPKLSHVTNTLTTDPHKMSDNELAGLLAELKAKAQPRITIDVPDPAYAEAAD